MFVTQALAQTETPPGVLAPQPPAEATQVHAETVHTEGHEEGFPPFNSEYFPSQILWLAITFGIFYLLLKDVILPRIGGILENRRDRIALDLETAERMKGEADEAQAAYEQELAEARQNSQRIAQEARDAARRDADTERAQLESELDEKLSAAQARIAEIKRQALSDVGQIAEEAAQAILSDVAGLDASQEEITSAVRAVRS